jgi:EAL domain-containing protein (putative c-di-GMP-specific phosphodiesterase class I)
MSAARSSSPNLEAPARVVLVDDDPLIMRALTTVLTREGYVLETFGDPRAVVERARDRSAGSIDLIVSDITMPQMTGLEMLGALREQNTIVPVVFLTGAPRVGDAMSAMELGAFRYLAKPIDLEQLRRVVSEAIRWGRLTRAATDGPAADARARLEAAFGRALGGIELAFQPIVVAGSGELYGYEALMRSSEPELPSPPAVLDAAEKLGRLHELGRHLRDRVAQQARDAGPRATFFVNLHPSDLADPTLYDVESPLTEHAPSIVLEITERASLEGIDEVEKRIARLRSLGFRIAVDDLGAGYAGLSYFARVSPDVVKVDMSLTRGIDADPVRRRVVGSLCALAHDLHMTVVAEGIETEAELACVTRLGVELVQGFFIARPAPYPASASGVRALEEEVARG